MRRPPTRNLNCDNAAIVKHISKANFAILTNHTSIKSNERTRGYNSPIVCEQTFRRVSLLKLSLAMSRQERRCLWPEKLYFVPFQ